MSQSGFWKQLTSALQKERDTYHQLFALLSEELSALKKMDHLSLADLNSRKEHALEIIAQCEQERTAVLKNLAGPSFQGDLLEWLSHSRSSQAGLAKRALHELVAVGKQVKKIGESNSGLTVRALHVVRETLNIIHSGLGAQPVYGESGQLRFPSMATSLNLQG